MGSRRGTRPSPDDYYPPIPEDSADSLRLPAVEPRPIPLPHWQSQGHALAPGGGYSGESPQYPPPPGGPYQRPESGYFPSEYGAAPRRPSYVMVVLVSALVSALTAAGLFLGLDALAGGSKVAVPALVGLSVEEARAAAQNAGLVIQSAGNVHDPVISRGKVARQIPLAGASGTPGSAVAVTLSLGPSRLTLPELSGLTLVQARESLKELGMQSGAIAYQAHETIAAGMVVTSNPPPGTVLPSGSEVGLVVARGEEPAAAAGKAGGSDAEAETRAPELPRPAAPAGGGVAVPRVTGVRLPGAVSRLRRAGLTVGRVSYGRDEDHMEDFVLSQSPGPGERAGRGEAVDLVVNRID